MQIISSRENPSVKRVIHLQTDKKYRQKENAFVCEGETMLAEAIRSGFQIESLYVSADFKEPQKFESVCKRAAIVPQQILRLMSDIETAATVIFVCKMPEAKPLQAIAPCLVLEDLRDPGNMGTIIRTADAFGIPIILTGGCVDIFSPKVVRATMGSIFRVSIMRATIEKISATLQAKKIPLFAAALSETATDLRNCDISNAAVIIGNEAAGISPNTQSFCDGDIIIPIQNAESLNAAIAAAIVMWTFISSSPLSSSPLSSSPKTELS